MSLCPACSSISVQSLTRELDDPPDWMPGVGRESHKPRGMVHHNDARHLIASASAGCPFCNLMVEAVLQYNNFVYIATDICDSPIGKSKEEPHELDVIYQLAREPIYLQTNYDPVKPSFPEDGVAGSWHIRGVKVFVPAIGAGLLGRIRLYAERDSPAGLSCDIIGRPSVPSSDSPQAFDLIQRWMSACLSKHQACRESLSGSAIDESTPPVLPTRVIHVGTSNQAPSPRLLETRGRRGHYVALSHCWGPPAHRPLMTIQSSLAEHTAGIPWDNLPQLYQDAISATHRLGFEYIWIDSLCITQDSHSDWLSESQRMGDVYQHARLTIAASHASDSTQSLFVPRQTPARIVELPHVTADGQFAGSIFASVLAKDYESLSPESGALAFRAWATQEWLLSRRMIFYTKGSIVWSCKVLSQRETGASFHSTARNTRWKNLVEKYSARELTQQTDRLIALEGVRSEMAKARVNDVYCSGLWKNSMPDQLMWSCLRPAQREQCELNLPTWTWASTMQSVRYLEQHGAKNVCQGFQFNPATQTLTIRSQIRPIKRILPHHHRDSLSFMLIGARPSPPPMTPTEMMFFPTDEDVERGTTWCVMDEGELPESEVCCLRLMTSVEKNPRQGVKKLVREWVLILAKVAGEQDMFKRVGVGSIERQNETWFTDIPVREVHLQ